MSIVGGFDVHRKQITFDYLDTVTGEVKCGRIVAADRRRLAAWLERFTGCDGGMTRLSPRTFVAES